MAAATSKFVDIQVDLLNNLKTSDDGNASDADKRNLWQRPPQPAFVYLVDSREAMFSELSKDCPILISLECIRKHLRQAIFSSTAIQCAIILIGTNKTENFLGVNNLFELHRFQAVGAETIKTIDKLITTIKNKKFESEYGYVQNDQNVSLADSLWLAITALKIKGTRLNKVVYLFTNNDLSMGLAGTEEVRFLARALDLPKLGIRFCLLPIGPNFNISSGLYKEIVEVATPSKVLPVPALTEEDLIEACNSFVSTQTRHHVALTHLQFYISDDFHISVSIHYVARRSTAPPSTLLHKATNAIVHSEMVTMSSETGEIIDPIKYALLPRVETISGQKIQFSSNEIDRLKVASENKIRLIGFKPANWLSLEFHVGTCPFIYPSDKTVKGSSTFFAALWSRCKAKQVVPICTYCPRKASSVRFVALLPQEGVEKRHPPGFWLVFLPFADEIRDVDEENVCKESATPEQTQLLKDIVKKMRFSYSPDKFPNPKLAQHWRSVEALALDLPHTNASEGDFHDETLPNYEMIGSRIGELTEKFLHEFYPDGYVPEGSAPKRSKPNISIGNIEEMAREHKIGGLTVSVLREYLSAVGYKHGLSQLKKQELVQKVYSHLNIVA